MVMRIDKEKSLTFVSIKSKRKFVLVPIGNGVLLNKNFEINYKNAVLDVFRVEASRSRLRYYDNVRNADLSEYDNDFVNLFRSGIISFYGNEIPVNDLYIEHGTFENKTRNFVSSINDDFTDRVTNNDMTGFKRNKIMALKWSMFFYNLYLLCKEKGLFSNNKLLINEDIKDDVIKMLDEYDGKTQHIKTPESYYKFN